MTEKYLYEVKFSAFSGMTYMVVTSGPNIEAAIKRTRKACEADAEDSLAGYVVSVECAGVVLMA